MSSFLKQKTHTLDEEDDDNAFKDGGAGVDQEDLIGVDSNEKPSWYLVHLN